MKNKYKHPFNHENVKIVSETRLSSGYLKLKKLVLKHTLFSGGESEELHREVLHRGIGVGVLPYDPQTNQVVLIEQFRPGALLARHGSPWLLEIIAGMLDAGETPERVAHREALEEAGLNLKNLQLILDYLVSPGASSERFVIFYAEVDLSHYQEGIFGLAEEGEDIQVRVFPFEQAWEMFEQGVIHNAHTMLALQWLKLHKLNK